MTRSPHLLATAKPAISSAGFLWGLLTLAASLALINACYYPPFHDFGEWIYQAYLAKSLATHSLPFVTLKPWPVPNSISELVMALLMVVLSPIGAARVFLSGYVLGGAWVAFKISKIHGGSSPGALFVLLLGLIVFPTPLWTGETNYQVGFVLLSAYMFWLSRREKDTRQDLALDAALGVLLFLCHAICLAVFVVFRLLRGFQRKTLLATALSLAPAGALSLVYLYFNPRVESTEGELTPALHGFLDLIFYRIYMICKLGPYSNMIVISQGDFERARLLYYAGVAMNLLFGAVLILILARWLYTQVRSRNWSAETLTALTFILLYLWDPTKLVKVATIGERLLLPGVLLAVVGCAEAVRARRLAAVLSGSFLLCLVYWLVLLPAAPLVTEIANNAISESGKRYKLLFWHRPYLFSQQVMEAERSSSTHTPPTHHLAFRTSIIRETSSTGRR